MNSKVTQFISKSKHWNDEVVELRKILLSTKLEEDMKWNLPCYTHNGSNVVIIQPFKSYLGLMFFKGTLLKDSKKVLVANGPNSQATKRLEFSSVKDVKKLATTIKAYIKEAIKLEDSGVKVETVKKDIPLPTELTTLFKKNAKLKKAFAALTPGRQRAYLFFFTAAKQSATRQTRIEKYIPKILKGKGMLD